MGLHAVAGRASSAQAKSGLGRTVGKIDGQLAGIVCVEAMLGHQTFKEGAMRPAGQGVRVVTALDTGMNLQRERTDRRTPLFGPAGRGRTDGP
jgi:hypothetical protein